MHKFAYMVFVLSIFLILYHHLIYPLLLNFFARCGKGVAPGSEKPLNKFTFIIPMHNEAHYIAKKIANLDALDYPKNQFNVLLIDDGSTDKSLQNAHNAIKAHSHLRIKIQSFPINRGKVAVFNQVVPLVAEDHILFFSDVSASLAHDVLKRANRYFNKPSIGAFCTHYRVEKTLLTGEKKYRWYQTSINEKESILGTPIGYHGAGYAIRKSSWQELPENLINDDFVIPMHVIAKGYIGIYDKESVAIENEPSTAHHDWHRRIRIGSGNIQQIFLLRHLLSPRMGFIAWMFLSNKVLRTIIPWLLIFLWCSNLYLAKNGMWFFKYLWWAQNLFYLSVLFNVFVKTRVTEMISYFVTGYTALLLGWFYWFKMNKFGTWRRTNTIIKKQYIHPVVFIGKWLIDKISGLVGVCIFLLFFPFVGLAIKLASPGPILYRQLRVGKTTDTHTQFFFLYKFRTMRTNITVKKNLWTKINDPRIFALGSFLRKTHLDELPQFLNILKGDMSLVGPRPERPSLFPYITKEIPFYAERLYWVKPGLTGLAQITYRYDKTIEDVRRKVAYDHAYAIFLTNPLIWFKTEVKILIKTVTLVLFGKGF